MEAALGGHHPGAAGRRPILNAASLASAPELAKKTRPPAAGELQQPLGQRDGRLGEVEVGDVAEGGDLAGDRLDHGRVGVAEALTAMPPTKSR